MGNDWGGRHASNPKGAPKVSAAQVRAAAAEAGVEVRRGDYYGEPPKFYETTAWSMWWWKKPGGEWLTAATTNYLVLEMIKELTHV